MDTPVVLVLSKALEEAKPLATRVARKSPLRRSYIMLYLAYRAACANQLERCREYISRAIPDSRAFGISGNLIGAYNYLDKQLQAA